MPADLIFWVSLATKMAATAFVVVVAAWAAERAGPLIAAMLATLPISAGAAYIFVALDHDVDFIAKSAVASLTGNFANTIFCITYTIVGRSYRVAVSLLAALGAWIALAVFFSWVEWTLSGAIVLNILGFIVCVPIAQKFRNVRIPALPRFWYDIPLRAVSVAILVAAVVALSSRVGPTVTGIIALFPIVITSLAILIHMRMGGRAAAAMTANSVLGLVGFAAALIAVNMTAAATGLTFAFALAFGISIAWNLMIIGAQKSRNLRR